MTSVLMVASWPKDTLTSILPRASILLLPKPYSGCSAFFRSSFLKPMPVKHC
jgi:hypothetical protein